MEKLVRLAQKTNISTLPFRPARLAQEDVFTTNKPKLAAVQTLLLSSLVLAASNASYLNTSTSKKNNA